VGRQDTLEGLHGISTTGPDTLPNVHNKERQGCVPFPVRVDNEVAEIRGGLTLHSPSRTRTRNVLIHGQVAVFETMSMVAACSIKIPLSSEEGSGDNSDSSD
jgi:hypothetical protein